MSPLGTPKIQCHLSVSSFNHIAACKFHVTPGLQHWVPHNWDLLWKTWISSITLSGSPTLCSISLLFPLCQNGNLAIWIHIVVVQRQYPTAETPARAAFQTLPPSSACCRWSSRYLHSRLAWIKCKSKVSSSHCCCCKPRPSQLP